MRPDRHRHAGFGIIAAIVILVILASLGGFMATLASNQQIGSALDVKGSQALAAAQSGIEWGLYQTRTAAPCAASTTLAISGYTVVVTCSTSNSGAAVEAGLGSIYALTATACSSATCPETSPGPFYVERRVTALIER